MTAQEWERVKEIFDAVLAEAPVGRAAFLQSNCGEDSALRREVERLLAEHERASGFLEPPSSGGGRFALSGSQNTIPEAPLIGQKISHYEIVAKLGEGGMGVVYRALDTQLLRPVAVKVLSHGAHADPESNRRFLREARAASALNHPNIAHVYEAGEVDNTRFIVMEHIDGRTLAAAIREGPLDFDRVLDFALQAADAMAEAHEHGIIHRDLKPSNIMITPRGQLKILDFGLAKVHPLQPDGADPSLSRPGLVIGTTRYMSPEQVLGQDVDQRSDIFSLGLVFYEMLTGHQAFSGGTATETMDRILHSEPEPIAAVRANVPPELQRIISKCIEKDRAKRYSSARELYTDVLQFRGRGPKQFALRMDRRRFVFTAAAVGIAGAITIAGIELPGLFPRSIVADSIAVLPFVNIGADPELEYLTDGITEGLINDLSQVPQLRVIARPTAFTFKGKPLDLNGIHRALNVQAVLTGKVSQHGQSLDVQADLVDVKNGSQLWGQQYDRARSEISDVQHHIFQQTVQRLGITLTPQHQARTRHTEKSEAYQLYLKGLYQLNQFRSWSEPDAWKKALDYFQDAIRIDPAYARGWSGLADTYYEVSNLWLPPREAMPKAKDAAMKALELDEMLGEAHASLAMVKAQYDWDSPGAEREFKRAIELNPGYATAHQWYGLFLDEHARFQESVEEFSRAQELDPVSAYVAIGLAWPLHHSGHYDEAEKQYQRVLEMYPKNVTALNALHGIRGESFLERGREKEAAEEFIEGEALSCDWCLGTIPGGIAALKIAYQTFGLRGYWQKALELYEEKYRKESQKAQAEGKSMIPFFDASRAAALYARNGYKDKAFALLESGIQNRDETLLFLKADSVRSASQWASIRSDARFADLLRRMGLEP